MVVKLVDPMQGRLKWEDNTKIYPVHTQISTTAYPANQSSAAQPCAIGFCLAAPAADFSLYASRKEKRQNGRTWWNDNVQGDNSDNLIFTRSRSIQISLRRVWTCPGQDDLISTLKLSPNFKALEGFPFYLAFEGGFQTSEHRMSDKLFFKRQIS